MKKMIVAMLLSCVAAFVPSRNLFAQISGQVNGTGSAQQINLVAPPQNRADGTASGSISDREGNTKAALGHPEYVETARRGKMYTIQTTTFTITLRNTSNQALGQAEPIIGFYNPTGSGVNANIVNSEEWHLSGTPGGPLIFNYLCNQNWTSASSGTVISNLLSNNTPQGSSMIPQNNQALATTPSSTSALLVFGSAGGPAAVAIATGEGEAGHSKDWKGQIVVPPGCFFGMFSTTAGTSDIISASLTWEETAQ